MCVFRFESVRVRGQLLFSNPHEALFKNVKCFGVVGGGRVLIARVCFSDKCT